MKHKHKDIEGSRREFAVEVSPEEVKRRLDGVYEEMKESLHIPGFRKGKIPRDILEKYHKKTAHERVLSDLVSDSYTRAARESDTIPVGLPSISDVKFEEEKSISYKAIVDIRPKVVLKRYKKIKIEKKAIDIKNEDVERSLLALRESYAQFKSVEDRPAKLGDYLICDIVCKVDGEPIQEEQKNIWLLLDKSRSVLELVDGLIGSAKGDQKEIEAKLPESKDPKYSKKEAVFKVKVNLIKEKHLPEINDEFIKGLGTYKNISELKEAARKDLIRKEESRRRAEMSNQILEQLLKNADFSAPKGLVDEEAQRLLEAAKEDLYKKNISKEDIEKRMDELKSTSQKEAIKNIRLFFILDEIARLENIAVTDKEVDQTLNLLAQQSNTSRETLEKYYKDNNLLPSLKNQLKESKIIDFLLDNADIKVK